MNKKDLAFWGIMILIFVLIVYLFFYIRSESYQCMKSPLVYGVSKYESSQGEFTCTCSGINSRLSLIVTKDNMTLTDSFESEIAKFIK